MSENLKAIEGIVLDQNGTVISGTGPSGRTGTSWVKGLLPKVLLAGVVAAALFFGFGIISLFIVIMLASLVIRTVLGFFGLAPERPRSQFIFTVKR